MSSLTRPANAIGTAALCAATTLIVNRGKARYAWVTLLPLFFVGVATETAGFELITETFIPKMIGSGVPGMVFQGYLLATLCGLAMVALIAVFLESLNAGRWFTAKMTASPWERPTTAARLSLVPASVTTNSPPSKSMPGRDNRIVA